LKITSGHHLQAANIQQYERTAIHRGTTTISITTTTQAKTPKNTATKQDIEPTNAVKKKKFQVKCYNNSVMY
jgi:hypothetical protein